MRRKLIVGNWKMNGSLVSNTALLEDIIPQSSHAQCDIVICPPSVYLMQCGALLADSALVMGAQDVSEHANGAFTGDVSASMLKDCGCSYVILGHSERRAIHGESNALIARKVVAAIEAGLKPILCVGETSDQRENAQTNDVIRHQIEAVLDVLPAGKLAELVVAYEPVWAIGTGKTATPEMAQEVHLLLRTILRAQNTAAANDMRILYGGSMKPDNVQALIEMPDIDGGLIGGAALKSSDFMAIVNAANNALRAS